MTHPSEQQPVAPRGPYETPPPAAGRRPHPIVATPAGSAAARTKLQQTVPPVNTNAMPPAPRGVSRADARKPRAVRRARLRLVRLDPWSVTKVTFLLSIAFGVMCAVAVFLIFSIMGASGLWDNVNSTIQNLVNKKDAFDIKEYVGMSRVMGITLLITAINVVLLTALATLGAFIYNMAASLLGGLEVTLAEDLP
ncbi:MAG: DUF3566 domain-containing protein [Nocardioidaceae bacterium]|nr:DUF3566 domain-containing protein [Nocardioidaceae bacterium]